MSKNNIIELAELDSDRSEIVNTEGDLMMARRAIMVSSALTDIVLGAADGKRIIEARLDETSNAIFPAFKLTEDK